VLTEPPSFVPAFSSVAKSELNMAKLTRSQSLSALADGEPNFSAGPGRFTIGLTCRENRATTYHVHLSEHEARRLAAFIAERVESIMSN
jgi:hypothetical protein